MASLCRSGWGGGGGGERTEFPGRLVPDRCQIDINIDINIETSDPAQIDPGPMSDRTRTDPISTPR